MINTWQNEILPDGYESDVWVCPDCEWAVILESYNELDVDAPVEHEYNYCPHCGKKRLIHSDEDKTNSE